MSEAPTATRVRVKNHSEAPQGIYEAHDLGDYGVGQYTGGDVATYIRPGAMETVTVDAPTLKHLRDHPQVFGVFEAADEAEPPAKPAPTGETAPDPAAASDQFDAMSDDELRAFLTDRGQKPHNFAGRPKLLIMARGPADAPDADAAETV